MSEIVPCRRGFRGRFAEWGVVCGVGWGGVEWSVVMIFVVDGSTARAPLRGGDVWLRGSLSLQVLHAWLRMAKFDSIQCGIFQYLAGSRAEWGAPRERHEEALRQRRRASTQWAHDSVLSQTRKARLLRPLRHATGYRAHPPEIHPAVMFQTGIWVDEISTRCGSVPKAAACTRSVNTSDEYNRMRELRVEYGAFRRTTIHDPLKHQTRDPAKPPRTASIMHAAVRKFAAVAVANHVSAVGGNVL